MSVVDPVALTIGIAAGAAAGIAISYIAFYNRPEKARVQVVQRDSSGQLRRKSITAEELQTSRREMRTLMLERDLLSAALTKVYEAETEGQITREEREIIARRYSSQIRDFESRLRDRELIVEVGELEGLRDELVSLFRDKIQNIESRLDSMRERLGPALREEARPEPARAATPSASGVAVRASGTASSPPVVIASTGSPASAVSQTDDLERVVERKAPSRRDESEGEKRVKALREEILNALAELEQIDTKKETEQA